MVKECFNPSLLVNQDRVRCSETLRESTSTAEEFSKELFYLTDVLRKIIVKKTLQESKRLVVECTNEADKKTYWGEEMDEVIISSNLLKNAIARFIKNLVMKKRDISHKFSLMSRFILRMTGIKQAST